MTFLKLLLKNLLPGSDLITIGWHLLVFQFAGGGGHVYLLAGRPRRDEANVVFPIHFYLTLPIDCLHS